MVSFLLKLFTAIFIHLSSVSTAYAMPQLLLFTDNSEIEYGRPIRVELVGVSLKEKLSTINLKPLNLDFGIVTDFSINNTLDKRWSGQTVQILHIKLYPRKTGPVKIPSLSVGSTFSNEKTINVIPGNTLIREISLANQTPYAREQVILKITIESDNFNARLNMLDTEENSGFEVTPLEFKRSKLNNKYILQTGLSVTPLVPGQQKLKIPPIEYSVDGIPRKLFYLEPQKLTIRKLPAYLPPTIPTDHISVKTSVSENGIYSTGSLYYWTITITTNTANTYRLPPVLQQIRSSDTFHFLPAESNRRVIVTQDNITSEAKHIIPFKVLNSGLSRLPKLKFQYFDPGSGTIKNTVYIAPDIFALNTVWKILLILSLLMLIIVISTKVYRVWVRYKLSAGITKKAKTLLQHAVSISELRDSIKLIAVAESWPVNSTITQWQKHWSEKYIINRDFEELISKISDTFYYNKNDADISLLSKELLRNIQTKKRIRRLNLF